jgi:hypothetical protein
MYIHEFAQERKHIGNLVIIGHAINIKIIELNYINSDDNFYRLSYGAKKNKNEHMKRKFFLQRKYFSESIVELD